MALHLTSTFAAFKAALTVKIVAAAEGVQVAYGMPGQPSTKSEGIYLGDVQFDPISRDEGDRVAAGRRYRDEWYTVEFMCRSWRPTSVPTGAATADARAAELFAIVENVVAENIRMADTVNWCYAEPTGTTTTPFQSGLAIDLSGLIHAHARLT